MTQITIFFVETEGAVALFKLKCNLHSENGSVNQANG